MNLLLLVLDSQNLVGFLEVFVDKILISFDGIIGEDDELRFCLQNFSSIRN